MIAEISPTWRFRALVALAIAIGATCLGLFALHALRHDPALIWLSPERGARWIRFSEPCDLRGRPASKSITLFRKRFTIGSTPRDARLTVRAFQLVFVQLDGRPVGEPRNEVDRWKEPREFDLAPRMESGSHELVLGVICSNGHPAVLAFAEGIGLATGSDWEATADGREWSPAADVDAPVDVALARQAPRVPAAMAVRWPFLLALFAGVFAASLARSRGKLAGLAVDAARLRWILLVAWLALAVNNIAKLPSGIGFDDDEHFEYIRWVAEHHALPLASDGWQMFQAPLYYLVSAPLYQMLSAIPGVHLDQALRIVPLACGMLQVEIAYRTMRRAFPERGDLQSIGTWIAGLLPMGLYVSQVIGNEPLSGLLSASALYLCVRWVMEAEYGEPLHRAAVLGACLGLAWLAKMSALVLFPVVLSCIAWATLRRGASVGAASARVALTALVVLLVGGWFYARNWIELGQPFIGGWDWKALNRVWWQDPGYRTPEQMLRFGTALSQPVYAAVAGFWDALYSSLWTDGALSGCGTLPPWNFTFMAVSAWFALPVSIAIVIGALWPMPGSARHAQVVALGALSCFLFALLYLYLKVPIYSTAKATYMLGLTPCFGLLAAAGFRPLIANAWARAGVHGWIACLGVSAYIAYFVV